MNRSRHEQLSEIFARARRLDGEARSAYLTGVCLDDSEMRKEVISLLEQVDSSESPLEDMVERELGVLAAESLDEEEARTQPSAIGPYRVIRAIGRGGMGIVYEAEQKEPRRRVAVKVIRASFFSESLLERFRHEVQILGRLKHPGIAQIYEAGSDASGGSPQPYLVMELIDGRPLLEDTEANCRDRLFRIHLVIRICDAIQHAHDRGVIHRDLKPGNILITDDGQPKVLDFGVAGPSGEAVSELGIHPGAIVGTVPYMSPEQASGTGRLDGCSDVYSLGVILFEALTGTLPYPVDGLSLDQSLRLIAERPPTRLRAVDPSLRGDLEAIVAKCLSKNPDHRYIAARFLADDLRRFLANEPVVARRRGAMYSFQKLLRRNWHFASAGVVTVFMTWLGLYFSQRHAAEASTWKRIAESSSIRIDELEKENRGLAEHLQPTSNEDLVGLQTRVIDILAFDAGPYHEIESQLDEFFLESDAFEILVRETAQRLPSMKADQLERLAPALVNGFIASRPPGSLDRELRFQGTCLLGLVLLTLKIDSESRRLLYGLKDQDFVRSLGERPQWMLSQAVRILREAATDDRMPLGPESRARAGWMLEASLNEESSRWNGVITGLRQHPQN